MTKGKQLKEQLEDLFSDVTLPEPTVTDEQPSQPDARETPQVAEAPSQETLEAPIQPAAPSWEDTDAASVEREPEPFLDSLQDQPAWRQMLERWLAVPTDDPDLARKGRLFGGLLLASTAFTLAVTVVVDITLLRDASFPALPSLGISTGGLIVSLISLCSSKADGCAAASGFTPSASL